MSELIVCRSSFLAHRRLGLRAHPMELAAFDGASPCATKKPGCPTEHKTQARLTADGALYLEDPLTVTRTLTGICLIHSPKDAA